MKGTRSKTASKKVDPETTEEPIEPRSLQKDSNPPRLFVLPKDASQEARIVTLTNPTTSTPNRYYFCRSKGFYEFMRIAAPKSTPRSWLLAPENAAQSASSKETGSSQLSEGYVTQNADLFVATPMDPAFLLLPSLCSSSETAKDSRKMFLSLEDHLDKLADSSDHIRQLLRSRLTRRMLQRRMAAICDSVDAGPMMYRLSMEKLLTELTKKAEHMVEKGLPPSMEHKLVTKALEVPITTIKRQESSVTVTAPVESEGDPQSESMESQDSTASLLRTESQSTALSATTPMTSVSITADSSPETSDSVPEGVPHLLRLRVALDLILSSYIPASLQPELRNLLSNNKRIDFSPLDAHMNLVETRRAEALALRSMSENISRKRMAGADDDEAAEARAEKKRKKEEEEKRKKNESRGVKDLKKVNTTGMKKMESFFKSAPTKKANTKS